jgi:hypothetical protein
VNSKFFDLDFVVTSARWLRDQLFAKLKLEGFTPSAMNIAGAVELN